ncbi:hypothetical protein AXG93_93s1180 [Marchantia polymorpha subsp. ruderalis]|uniref:Reverse transcriptase Ty1/copia-type domain-containing protein n=1 Tax=Marchantia polymorpha subsp. ruderalis TaxID=1480154 RepID=A0A176WS99_MARPO|nr:hypothetical protein AXG93_93s1180 [Marchantia polymorpha subsp. ruderalis]
MLSESGLPGEFSAEAVNTIIYLVVLSRDVSFNEPGLLKEGENVEANKGKSLLTDIVVGEFDHSITNDPSHEETPIHVEQVLEEQEPQEQAIVDEHIATIPNEIDQHEDGMALILEEGEPSSYREAQASVNKLEWNVAMEREMQSLIDNKTWELVELPKDHTVIDSKWLYKLKDNPAGDDARIFKARLMARGFTQEKGVDYNEVFRL